MVLACGKQLFKLRQRWIVDGKIDSAARSKWPILFPLSANFFFFFRDTDSFLTVSQHPTVSNKPTVKQNMAASFIKANNLGVGSRFPQQLLDVAVKRGSTDLAF